MFKWLYLAGLSFWGALNYWSIVPIAIIMIAGAVIWKTAMTPREYQERVAWDQNKENERLTQPKIRRLGITLFIWAFGFMCSTFFCVAMFMMLKDGLD